MEIFGNPRSIGNYILGSLLILGWNVVGLYPLRSVTTTSSILSSLVLIALIYFIFGFALAWVVPTLWNIGSIASSLIPMAIAILLGGFYAETGNLVLGILLFVIPTALAAFFGGFVGSRFSKRKYNL